MPCNRASEEGEVGFNILSSTTIRDKDIQLRKANQTLQTPAHTLMLESSLRAATCA